MIRKCKAEGWETVDVETAFSDEIFQKMPASLPAGESLIWSLAKESGRFELRYPAEDSRYELPRMRELGSIRD